MIGYLVELDLARVQGGLRQAGEPVLQAEQEALGPAGQRYVLVVVVTWHELTIPSQVSSILEPTPSCTYGGGLAPDTYKPVVFRRLSYGLPQVCLRAYTAFAVGPCQHPPASLLCNGSVEHAEEAFVLTLQMDPSALSLESNGSVAECLRSASIA